MKPGAKPTLKPKTNLKTDKVKIYARQEKHKIVEFSVTLGESSPKLIPVKKGKDGIVNAFKIAEKLCEDFLKSLEPKKPIVPLKRLR